MEKMTQYLTKPLSPSAQRKKESERNSLLLQVAWRSGLHIHHHLWNTSKPMGLGHPFQWVLTFQDETVTIRSIAGPLNKVISSAEPTLISLEDLEDGVTVTLPGSTSTARIKKTRSLPSAFQASVHRIEPNSHFQLLSQLESGAIDSRIITDNSQFSISEAGQSLFSVKREQRQILIQASVEGLLAAGKKLSAGSEIRVSLSAAEPFIDLQWNHKKWRVRTAQATELRRDLTLAPTTSTSEERTLRRATKAVGSLALVLMTLVLLWPKPDPEKEVELIPPQVARFILTEPQTPVTPDASGSSTSMQKSTESKTQPTQQTQKLAQAFRAKALQNSVDGLLKGGMTRLLAQSNQFLTSQSNDRILQNSQQSQALGDMKNVGAEKSVTVASVGGGAIGGEGKGPGVGYGKGEKAGIAGQGQGLIDLDISGAEVAEGLTRDEVGAVIHKHLSEIRYCYESGLVRNPDLQGKLITDFKIDANGIVATAMAKESNLQDPRTDDCILRRLQTWKFPKPRGGVTVSVAYPFIFKSLGR